MHQDYVDLTCYFARPCLLCRLFKFIVIQIETNFLVIDKESSILLIKKSNEIVKFNKFSKWKIWLQQVWSILIALVGMFQNKKPA